MIHELRIYHCMPGRLPDLLKRFETITLAIWERFGIRQAGFWTVEMGASNQDLYYLLEWESLAEREEKWGAFHIDAEWLERRAETEKDGPIVASISNTIASNSQNNKSRYSRAGQAPSYSIIRGSLGVCIAHGDQGGQGQQDNAGKNECNGQSEFHDLRFPANVERDHLAGLR